MPVPLASRILNRGNFIMFMTADREIRMSYKIQ